MTGDVHGAKTQEATQGRLRVSGKDWEKANGRIAELEQQVDEQILWEVGAAPKLGNAQADGADARDQAPLAILAP